MPTAPKASDSKIDLKRLPRHLAIIMDGNGRWAKARRKARIQGHFQGAAAISAIARACSDLGIGYLTLYAFSEENWSRPAAEVTALMQLLKVYLKKKLPEFMKHDIRLESIGNRDKLPPSARKVLESTIATTANNHGMVLTLALSYSGRDELVRAVRGMIDAELTPKDITVESFSRWLDTRYHPDPDLLIRTSGEMRLSNFMLWQLAYTELVVTQTLWPDFHVADLYAAILEFQDRSRRFGGISEHFGAGLIRSGA